MMRLVLILTLILLPFRALACDNPWSELKKEIDSFGWKTAEVEGTEKANFVYHFNNDLEPVTNFQPEHVYLSSHKFEPTVIVNLVTDGCVLVQGQLKEESAARYMAEAPEGI